MFRYIKYLIYEYIDTGRMYDNTVENQIEKFFYTNRANAENKK